MRIIMSQRRYDLIDIILPYVYKENDTTKIKDDAPADVKEAFEEYMNLPPEPEPF